MNAWILLVIAGLFEVVWAGAMKASDGFSNTGPSIVTGVAAFISFWLLALAMKDLPLGTAYVVWVGIGAIGAALLGIAMFGDEITPLRLAGIALVAAGIAALKFA
ncbi:multidrug efflux SMR transporter [Sulfitobacter sp. F26169L]|uniref:DMT family transporter n=1 Tax=Sulfitobacter sp. F26169L TaxID=2996015 RepID=UPI002260EA81|nr:multidrug efflux SMR transporter [Sulfitobacter sp. F26169L]MCX7566653.1 multidrug efflux SMR transporter [Sulfitobacter sp. F26169L]